MVSFPAVTDKLFAHDFPDWRNNAVQNYMLDKFSFYADGYKHSAEILVRECIADRTLNDIVVFPIVFLYRQYIELRLKEIIINLLYCTNGSKDFPTHHRIDELWKDFIRLYDSLGEDTSDKYLQNAACVIKELSAADPVSMAFRYPVDKKGNDLLDLTHINIRNFGEVMERLANLLDAISDQVADYKVLANEIYRDNH